MPLFTAEQVNSLSTSTNSISMVLEMEVFNEMPNKTVKQIDTTTMPSTTDLLSMQSKEGMSVAAFASTVAFGILVFVSSGGLLVIFIRHRGIAKHTSMIMISTLANFTAGAFFDLALRAPLFAFGEQFFAKIHPKLCAAVILAPDFFMVAILLCLPLLSIERLLRLETKEHLSPRQARRLFSCLLVIAYSLAFVFSILPATNLFDPNVNYRCDKNLVYGYSYAFIYTGLTAASVMLTGIFSTAVAFRLRIRLAHMRTSARKKIIVKQGAISAIAITGLLFFALVPFTISLQVVLMCYGRQIEDVDFCKNVVIDIIFRSSLVLQKLCQTALPFVFLALNPSLRRKLWLTLKGPKKVENIMTISTATGSKESVGDEITNYDVDDEDDGDFITIAEDLDFGKSGDLRGEVKRRGSGSMRNRQSVLDIVDVLSVISERSESRSSSPTFDESGTSGLS